jgi:hypothetical protein
VDPLLRALCSEQGEGVPPLEDDYLDEEKKVGRQNVSRPLCACVPIQFFDACNVLTFNCGKKIKCIQSRAWFVLVLVPR